MNQFANIYYSRIIAILPSNHIIFSYTIIITKNKITNTIVIIFLIP